MLLTILLIIVRLAASLYLFSAGVLLLFEDESKKSVILWGAGLVFWSGAVFVSLFAFTENSNVSLAFYGLMRLILLVSFVVLLMRGTLGLLLPERETTILIAIYAFIVLILDFSINPMVGSQYDNFAFHSVYLTLPLTIVFFSYFYTYYMQLQDKTILFISLSWGVMFTMTLIYILSNSMGIRFLEEILLLLNHLTMIMIAFSFDHMRKSSDNWHEVTVPKKYVIDTGLARFIEQNNADLEGKKIIEEELVKTGNSSLHKMPVEQQKIFIDNLVNSHFPQYSMQKKGFIKSKMMSIAGVKVGLNAWVN